MGIRETITKTTGTVSALVDGTDPNRAQVAASYAIHYLTTIVTGSQQQAVLGSMFFIMPAVLLSGFMTPIENMPDWIVPLTWINPMRYFVEIMRANLLKGAGFADLIPQFLALFLFGLAILTLSALRFRKRLA